MNYAENQTSNVTDLAMPVHRIHAEQAVLGALLISTEAYDAIADTLQPGHFYRDTHRQIFEHMQQLHNAGGGVDVITLHERMEQSGKSEAVGGIAYLGTLAKDCPSVTNVAVYAQSIIEAHGCRELGAIACDMREMGYKPDGRSVADMIDVAEGRLSDLAESRIVGDGLQPVSAAVPAVLDSLSADVEPGIATGIETLTAATGNFRGGQSIIIAGRPAMGKTALALMLAWEFQRHGPVAFFSLEMPKEELIERLAANLGGIDYDHISRADMTSKDWDRMNHASRTISQSNLFIDDAAHRSVNYIRSQARQLKRRKGLSAIVIDYLQLIDMQQGKNDNRTNAVGHVSRAIKRMAKELDVPVVVLSQLSRECEKRNNKRPMPADLRESGDIEQDADKIIFCYRDDVYHKNTNGLQGYAELIVAKNRKGKLGTAYTRFSGAYQRFKSCPEPAAVKSSGRGGYSYEGDQ